MRTKGTRINIAAFLVFLFLSSYVLGAEDRFFTILRSKIDANFFLTSSMLGTVVVNVGATEQNIGELTFSSNIPGAWRISIASQNVGALVRDGGAERFPYRFNFGAEKRNQELNSNLIIEYFGPKSPTTVALSLDYSPAFSLGIPMGTYRDTIVITLSAL